MTSMMDDRWTPDADPTHGNSGPGGPLLNDFTASNPKGTVTPLLRKENSADVSAAGRRRASDHVSP